MCEPKGSKLTVLDLNTQGFIKTTEGRTVKNKVVEVVCVVCKTSFSKEQCEIDRAKRKGQQHCCSRSCASRRSRLLKSPDTIGFGFYHKNCKKGAERKGLDFDLTHIYLKELWDRQEGKCALTGVSLVMNRNRAKADLKSIYYGSVDRIDSKKGYVIGNVQFVALGINYMKNNFDLEEVKDFIEKIQGRSPAWTRKQS